MKNKKLFKSMVSKSAMLLIATTIMSSGAVYAQEITSEAQVTKCAGKTPGKRPSRKPHYKVPSCSKPSHKVPSCSKPDKEEVTKPEIDTTDKEEVTKPEIDTTDKEEVTKPEIDTTDKEEVTKPEIDTTDKEEVTKPETDTTDKEETTQATFENEVLRLINVERQNKGLKPLQMDESIRDVARIKATDMYRNKYFSHTSPTYGTPFQMLKKYGITYKSAGENIAKGQTTPQQVVKSWMNSSGHRANILNANYTHIGIGYEANGHHWVQMFVGK